MNPLMKYIRMTVALGVLTLLSMFLSVLALNDIAQGESDLTLEWGALRVTAFVMLVFVAVTFVTLRRTVDELRKTTHTEMRNG